MKRPFGILAVLGLWALLAAGPVRAFTIGTFNIEYFTVSGKGAYSDGDCFCLAEAVRKSGADLLALQEIRDSGTMRYFITRYLPDFAYAGNDTGSRQDLYFIWKKDILKLVGGPVAYGTCASFNFRGKSYRLNDRPHLAASFVHKKSGFRFTAVNVHLKSQSTRGKEDKKQAELYNSVKKRCQLDSLEKLVESMEGPLFVLGDFNSDHAPSETAIPLLGLTEGYSYDKRKSNLDYIGYWGMDESPDWVVREVESSIPSRSTKRSEHPDHDILVLDLN